MDPFQDRECRDRRLSHTLPTPSFHERDPRGDRSESRERRADSNVTSKAKHPLIQPSSNFHERDPRVKNDPRERRIGVGVSMNQEQHNQSNLSTQETEPRDGREIKVDGFGKVKQNHFYSPQGEKEDKPFAAVNTGIKEGNTALHSRTDMITTGKEGRAQNGTLTSVGATATPLSSTAESKSLPSSQVGTPSHQSKGPSPEGNPNTDKQSYQTFPTPNVKVEKGFLEPARKISKIGNDLTKLEQRDNNSSLTMNDKGGTRHDPREKSVDPRLKNIDPRVRNNMELLANLSKKPVVLSTKRSSEIVSSVQMSTPATKLKTPEVIPLTCASLGTNSSSAVEALREIALYIPTKTLDVSTFYSLPLFKRVISNLIEMGN